MPCFQGLAVSVHTPDGPLPEYSIQKQSKHHRITSYIPVPPPKIPASSSTGKPEQSTFAISITLLTPGLSVPYSTPKPSALDESPKAKIVGGLPGTGNERNRLLGAQVGPYVPLTSSHSETIAAYIYFDGRAKEEVATLLRKGEETWVNSRWVSVPDSEGGGLAEREFLFREVGLERWLNGLDLDGQDAAARIERRKKRLEQKRKKRNEAKDSDDEEEETNRPNKKYERNGVLRYGDDKSAPVETLSADDSLLSSSSDSSEEKPLSEAAGQIKVALFRVLASGEVKRGEYSPQFDAHDDEDLNESNGNAATKNAADIDHTTSFAKPKTLDPKTISTQTVTAIDPPDKPYAVFSFFYRGERQLQKMGILPGPSETNPSSKPKRKSTQLNFGQLAPLTSAGTKNFAGYRDSNSTEQARSKKNKSAVKKRTVDPMDSDADDEETDSRMPDEEDLDLADGPKPTLSPEDALRQGELAEGVRKIKLKRQHSAEPVSVSPAARASPRSNSPASNSPDTIAPHGVNLDGTPTPNNTTNSQAHSPPPKSSATGELPPDAVIGSPFKKHRPSVGFEDGGRRVLHFEPSAVGLSGTLSRNIGGAGLMTEKVSDFKIGGALDITKSKPPAEPLNATIGKPDDIKLTGLGILQSLSGGSNAGEAANPSILKFGNQVAPPIKASADDDLEL